MTANRSGIGHLHGEEGASGPGSTAGRGRGAGGPDAARLHGARILVVDDEAAVLRMERMVLERAGARVTAAENAARALSRLDEDSFDLIVTDISMPGASGLWLAEQVGERLPEVPVVLTSGKDLTPQERAHIERVSRAFLPKPFEGADLLRTLADVLARQR